jgi:glycosyltransferase involved in cell wall biosynthesis
MVENLSSTAAQQKSIKVLFVFSDHNGACTAKRTFEVVNALHQYKRDEISASIIFYQDLSEKDFGENDIIVFQRLGANQGLISPAYQEQLFHWMDQYRHQTIYVYDIDDYVFEEQNGVPISIMKHSHCVLLPNEFLAYLAVAHQPRYHIIRTHIDLETAENAPKIPFDSQFIHIGWFSIAAQGIDIIEEIYPKLLEKWEGKVLIHAYVDSYFIPLLKKRFKKRMIIPYPRISLKEMYALEKGMDILINPLNCHESLANMLEKITEEQKLKFLNSKSEIKYLHAGAAKKPLIATPIPAYRKAISHGITGFLAETPQDWLNYLNLLIDHPEERERVGDLAHKHVSENYTFKQVAQNYTQFFRDLKQHQ